MLELDYMQIRPVIKNLISKFPGILRMYMMLDPLFPSKMQNPPTCVSEVTFTIVLCKTRPAAGFRMQEVSFPFEALMSSIRPRPVERSAVGDHWQIDRGALGKCRGCTGRLTSACR